MASHLLSRLSSYETLRRRSLVRKVLLESLERRELMAADLWNTDESSYTSTLTQNVLSQASLSLSSTNPNLSGYDITSFLDSTLGGGSGSLTQRPWFGLIQSSYDQWSQSNGLAFSYSAGLQAEGEGDRLSAEGEAGGPRLLSVAPNASSIFTFNAVNTLEVAPTELTLRFDDFIDVNNLNGIRLRAAGKDGQFGNANDSFITPGWIGSGDNTRIIIMRFASTLNDDLYRVELAGTGPNAVRSTLAAGAKTLETRQFDSTPSDTTVDSVDFRLQLGAKVLAVVPQPVDRLPDGTLQPQPNKIRVYFNDDKLNPASAQNINYYQLIHTADSVSPNDDNRFLPTSAVYNQSANMVELTFSHDINNLPGAGAGTYRLRIGSSDVVNSVALPSNLVSTAEGVDIAGNVQAAVDLGSFTGSTSILRTGTIVTTDATLLQLDYPGSNFEPGHRDVQVESHLDPAFSADSNSQITTIPYNFGRTASYGTNAANQPVFTAITSDQMQRVREVLEFYSRQMGVSFVETEAAGMRIVVGDMFPVNGTQSAPGGLASRITRNPMAPLDPNGWLTILDGAETWDNTYGGNFFLAAMNSIGQLLGLSYANDLPVGTVMRFDTVNDIGRSNITSKSGSSNATTVNVFYSEPSYPGDQDVVHGQFLYRPDNRDVDTYRFVVPAGESGRLRIESVAERLSTASLLDTHVTLFKMTAEGPVVVALNDNSFGTDSSISIDLESQPAAVTYFLSITGKGNEDFNPVVPNSGSGAVTQGNYELRINFDSNAVAGQSLRDTSGTALDGDGDGEPGGVFNFWFRAAAASTGATSTSPRTIYVDKSFTGSGNGSPTQPMNNLNFATWPASAVPAVGDIVRVVGAPTSDLANVQAYEIGRGGVSNSVLSDGLTLQVPKGVTLMIDAGSVFKLQASQIATGSATASVDNSNSALQVLGIPGKPVYFTSYKDETMGIDTNPIATTASRGDWGGLMFRESVDRSQGRFGWERQGIFLNYVSGADIRFGGGSVTVLSPSQVVAPINLSESRPTIINNTITRSADAAISADPNSFEETTFTTPTYQMAGNFDPDYSRVGPDIRGNTVVDNSINGLFVRTTTVAGGPQSTMTVSGKFDDSDIVHVVAENLIVDSQPGGAILDPRGLDVSLVQLQQQSAGGTLTAGTNVRYKLTGVDKFGSTSPASLATFNVTLAGANNAIRLTNLPAATGDFVGRRLWRSTDGGVTYRLVVELDKATSAFLDLGATQAAVLQNANATTNVRSRPNARLEIEPGTIIKATGSRIETSPGATLLVEGTTDRRIIFTSRSDDRYGASGSFDTYNDQATSNAVAGDWGGIISRQLSTVSVDYALITYAGGVTPLPGGFAGFNALEIYQSDARVTNTRFESNGDGSGGNLAANRVGRGANDASVIHVVGSQPVIMNNDFVNNNINNTASISINSNALNTKNVTDFGRQTGLNDRIPGSMSNQGPLIRGNEISNPPPPPATNLPGLSAISGMRVRGISGPNEGMELTTESVWDDTDIVHVVQSEIVVPNFHTYGGLTLRSSADEGLVVKLAGANAGFTASGRTLDIPDRIGGSLRIVGTPGFPVVLTSLSDDSVGAGNDVEGRPILDTNSNGAATTPGAGNWRSVLLTSFANDRNVLILSELESDQLQDVGTNDDVFNSQPIGNLAPTLSGGDENIALGFVVDGSIASTKDLDVYSFTATADTPVWLDIDKTSGGLDSVIELLDSNGTILAQSDNSLSESLGISSRYVINDVTKVLPEQVRSLDSNPFAPANSQSGTTATDLYSTNPLDAGMRIVLPGAPGASSTYFVRVRSSNLSPGSPSTDLQDGSKLRGGLSSGTYRLQVRLQQDDEVPGSTVRYADIRFAATGIDVQGLPATSPLTGQLADVEGSVLNLGNIANSDRQASVTVSGTLDAAGDVDEFRMSIAPDRAVEGQANYHESVTFDIDYADGFGRPNTTLWVFRAATGNSPEELVFVGTNSNVADDQPAPASGTDLNDLTRGSGGTRDAYIGPVELPIGEYIVRITNDSLVRNRFSAPSLVRVEPIDSVRRISVDRFSSDNPMARPSETTNSPNATIAFSADDITQNRIEWNLSDVTTYVLRNQGQTSTVSLANAMTGQRVADVSASNLLNDIAISPAGQLVGAKAEVAGTPTTDTNGGQLYILNATGATNTPVVPFAATGVGILNTGIQTFTTQVSGTSFVVQQRNHSGLGAVGDAIVFNALGYHTSGTNLAMFGVGSRGNGQTTFFPGALDANNALVGLGTPSTFTTNIVYRLDPATGAAINPAGAQDRTAAAVLTGAGTNKIEFGRFLSTGVVNGLTEVNGTLFAVSNLGQFFRVNVGTNPTGAFGSVNPLLTITDPETGTAVAFNGLTRGPRDMANPLGGTFNNILFGTTTNGTIYAFNTNGVLQPVFPGFSYKTQVAGALGDGFATTLSGIDFSVLGVNLWHQTTTRATDDGHGRYPTPTNAAVGSDLGLGNNRSLYFGYQAVAQAGRGIQQGTWNNVFDISPTIGTSTYNVPGGAHGAVVSNPFDLTDYSPSDLPMLYFNYHLSTENQNANFENPQQMRDAFRVYGAGDDGQWILLATNNTPSDNGSDRGNSAPIPFNQPRNGQVDELDNNVNGNWDAYGQPQLSQMVYDNQGQWRQARVPLSALAGKSNVRLRFEFSSGATMYSNDPLLGGVEIISVAGRRIVDGTGFILTPNSINGFATTEFEFEHGLVLAMPSGPSLTSGVSSVTVNGTTFTFSLTNNTGFNIQYSATDSAATIAQLLINALQNRLGVPANDVTVDPERNNVFAVANLNTVGTYGVSADLSATDILLGTPGVLPGAVPINVNLEMTVAEVRDAIRLSLAQALSQPNMLANFGLNAALQAWPFYFDTIQIFKFDVLRNSSAIGVSSARVGDFFGASKSGAFGNHDEKLQNNAFEGVYIDDIIIGFAERGEMVMNGDDNSVVDNFVPNPERSSLLYGVSQIETGSYQLTIRTSADYGTGGSLLDLSAPPGAPPNGRDFDTNDRLVQSTAIAIPFTTVGNIPDGTTFTLSDTKNILTFEFDVNAGATDVSTGVAPGNVRVAITNTATAHDIALAIRDAINSATAQATLAITASVRGEAANLNGGFGATVELFGAVSTDLNGGFNFPAILTGIRYGLESQWGEDEGDADRARPQGQVVLFGNTITNSQTFGIRAEAFSNGAGSLPNLLGATGLANGAREYPGAPIAYPTLNTAGYAPGVVIMNNILANNASGGVRVADNANAASTNPIARIVNNTFFGGINGVQAVGGASPTVINNIFANTSSDAVSGGANIVVGANLYSGSNNPFAAIEPFDITATRAVFVSTTNNKFYLASNSEAIDSSLNVLQERNELTLVKNSIGLPPSPTLSPDQDLNGQTRLDDPSVNSPIGMGANVFKDRGAVERADFTGPVAAILQPQDNDAQNVDADRNVTYIRTQQADLNSFSFLLQDLTGTGPDPATVVSAAVVLTENGRVLRQGSDYVMGYNANSRQLRLTPLAGIWRNDSVYEITLNNRNGHRVSLPSGASLRDGDRLTVVVGSTTTTLEFDNNGATTGTAIPFTLTSSAYELSTLIAYRLNLAGIQTRLEGDGDLFITGATNVTATTASAPGLIVVTAVSAIRDLAGNALVPNRSTNLTQFTIVMPEAQLDYGDSIGARIPTVESATALNGNGARNVILPVDYTVLALGTWADANSNGLPSAAADGDDSDVSISFGNLGGVTQGTAGPARLQMPAAAGLNGQRVAITDKVNPLFFEFTFNSSAVSNATTRYVILSSTDSASTVATQFAAAVRQAMISALLGGVTPIASGDIVSLGGSSSIRFDVSAAPSVTRLKQGQVDMVMPASLALIADAQTMSITDSRGRTVTFELNDTSVGSTATVGNVAVNVNLATATPASLAAAFSAAINAQVAAGNLSLGGASVVNTTTVRIFGDDEDGVTFDGLFNAGSPPVATFVTATDYGMLDVWVDWNADGDVVDASEKVFTTSIPVRPGVNRIDIPTPATAVSGFTTARFRISTLGGLLATGVGIGGETEDYMIEVAPGRPPVSLPDNYSVAEDNVLTRTLAQGVLSNDTDADLVTVIPGVNIFVNDENPTTLALEPVTNVTRGTLVLNSDGSFTYTPFAEFNGSDFFVYRATDGRLLGQNVTVSLTVTPVNDAPFANDDTLTVFEDSTVNVIGTTFTANDFAHYLLQTSSTGFQTNESSQVLTLVNAAIISSVDTSFGIVGTNVQFAARPGQGAYGLKVTFTSSDLGNAVAPTVTVVGGSDIRVTLNSNATTPSTIADMIGAIAGNLQANNLMTVSLLTGSAASVIGTIPSIPQLVVPPSGGTVSVANNRLNYVLPANYNNLIGGPVKLLLTISDDNTAGPTFNLTATSTLTLNVNAVNDAPSFTLPTTSLTVLEDAGLVTRTSFATNIAPGPSTASDEASQTLNFLIFSNSNPTLFATAPAISPSGTLTFQTAPDANGQAIVVVRLRDSGVGSGNGNVNTSPDQTFTINITPVNDAPLFTLASNTVTSREDQGLVQIVDFLTGIQPGPATAVDEVGQSVNVTVAAIDPSKFTVQPTIGADGRLVYQTATDVNMLNANLEVRITLIDNGVGTAPDQNTSVTTFTIQATPVNDAPVFSITNRNVVVNEDVGAYQEVMIGGVAAGPTTAPDEATQALTFNVISVSTPDLFSQQPIITRIGATGRLNFTTAANKNGTAVIVARLEDNGASAPPNVNVSSLQTFTITINPINDAPEFTIPGSTTVDEDQGLVSSNSFATNVRRGPVGADDENGQILQFVVTATYPELFSVQPRISVDGTLVYQVADNVNSLNAQQAGKSLEVKVQLRDDGLATPAPNQNISVEKTFTVIVNPINDPPQSPNFQTSTNEDTELTLQSSVVLLNAVGGPTTDELNQSVFMEQVERVSLRGGTVTPVFDVTNTRIVELKYNPPANASGIDSFVYVIRDNGSPARSGTATILVNILAVNDPPQFTIGGNQASDEDIGLVTVNNWATNILPGPFDAVDEQATQSVNFTVTVDNPSLFLVQPTVASDGTLTYQSALDANGSTVIRVRAVDNGVPSQSSVEQTATITVLPVNDAPVFAAGTNVTVLEDSGTTTTANWATQIAPAAGLIASPQRALDEQNQIVDFAITVDRPELFSLQPAITSTGTLSFTTAPNAFGSAVLTIRAVDRGPSGGLNQNTSQAATVTINITGVNDAPVAVNDNYTTDENSVLTVSARGVLLNDFDVDGTTDTIAVVPKTLRSNLDAVVTINADGSFTYDPSGVLAIQRMTTGQSLNDTFTYNAIDSSTAQSNLAVVNIRVNGVNDAPIAVNDRFAIGVGQTRLLEVLSNDTDIDSLIDGRTIQITQVPIFGSVIVNQTGVVQYAAEAGFRGTDTFGYVVRDAFGAVSNEAIVTVVVNNPPVANPDVTFTYKNEAIVVPVLANDSDVDGSLDPSTVDIVVLPTPSGTATVLSDGRIRYTPVTGFAGEVSLSYVVSDNDGATSNVAKVTIRVLNSKWQNPVQSLDVNADGRITPIDALLIINYLNDPTKDRFLPNTGLVPPPFLDVDGNERVSANDALLVVNFLNSQSAGGGGGAEGEGEGSSSQGTGAFYAMMVTPQDMVDTVGQTVVREVERLLAQLREEALIEAAALSATGSNQQSGSNDDWMVALLPDSEDKTKSKSKNVDQFFEDLLGSQLN